MSYFKYIVYFLISIVDSVMNFMCAFMCYYPGVDLSSLFLTRTELGRVFGVIRKRNSEREDKSQKALRDIKDISDGKNVS